MSKAGKKGCSKQFLIVAFILLLFLIGAFIGGSLFIRSMKSTPTVQSNTYLTWNIGGIAEYRQTQMFQFQRPFSMDTLRAILRSASDDDRIEGIIINFSSQAVSRSDIEEIADMIRDFQANGKKFYAYSDYFSLINYRLASMADKIFMPDTNNARISFTGYSAYQPYMKDMLERLGINMQIVHVGEYKGAGENLSRNTMSDEVKEDLQFILGGMFDIMVQDIANNRDMDKNEFKEDILKGKYAIFTPSDALNMGIIDELASYRHIKDSISNGNDINYLGISNYSPKFQRGKQKIAVVYGEGEIRVGNSSNQFSPFGGYTKVLGSDTIVKQFSDILKDDSIKGVVFRINSPGGSALASQHMYDAIKEVREKKPVIVSMSSIAGSGGYYIAAPADKIVVQPSTITGSIGVVSMIPDLSGIYENIGITFDGFHEGKYSDFGSTHRPFTEEELEMFKKMSGEIYHEFKVRVSEGRDIPMDEVEVLARGRIYTGLQAIEVGLADEVGGLDKAIEILKEKLGIPLDEEVNIVRYPREKTFFEMLQDGGFMGALINNSIQGTEIEAYHRLINDFANWVERAFYYQENIFPLMLYTGPNPDNL